MKTSHIALLSLLFPTIPAQNSNPTAPPTPKIVIKRIDLRTASERDSYYVHFSARDDLPDKKSAVGHAFVALGRKDYTRSVCELRAFGLHPKKENIKAYTFQLVPGHVIDDAKAGSLSAATHTLVTQVNKQHYLKAAKVIDRYAARKEYRLYFNDCVQLVRETAAAIGLQVPKRVEGLLPQAFIRQLMSMNKGAQLSSTTGVRVLPKASIQARVTQKVPAPQDTKTKKPQDTKTKKPQDDKAKDRGMPGAGVFTWRKGGVVRVPTFSSDFLEGRFEWTNSASKISKIRVRDLAEVEFLEWGDKYGKFLNSVRFVRRSGHEVLARRVTLVNFPSPPRLSHRCVSTTSTFTDPADGKKKSKTVYNYLTRMSRIIFGAVPGVKRCPLDGKHFMGDYWYCPFDAHLLEWVERPPTKK